jgi:mRNA interferase MazF
LCLACPITSRAKGYPFEVAIEHGELVTGVVLADQVRSVSHVERAAELIGAAPAGLVDEVREKIAALLEIE